MDSNFQVTIQANIQGLQKSIKDAQGVLNQFEKSAGGAAIAIRGVENNANRGRLAAFAFGQVIRDAGFFSQSFGLGLLAISNNIPILIDQLTMLAGITGAAGSAISLLGSILTAGLTIWAYSASAVDKNKQSIDEWRNSLKDTTEVQLKGKQAALDEVTSLDMLYKAATNVANSSNTRYAAAKQLQEQYPITFGYLSAEQISLGKSKSAYDSLRDSIIGAAMAEAAKDKIVENSSRILDNDTRARETRIKKIKQELELSKLQSRADAEFSRAEKAAVTTPGKEGVEIFTEYNRLKGLIANKNEEIVASERIIQQSNADTNILVGRNNDLWVEAGKYTESYVENLERGNAETEKTISLLDKLNQIFAKTRDNFKDNLVFPDTSLIDAIDELIYKGKTLSEVNDLITESVPTAYVDIAKIKEAWSAYDALKVARDGYFNAIEVQGLKNKLMESLVPTDIEVIASQWQLLAQGISSVLGNTFEDLGSLIAGSIGGEEFWGGILKSVGGFLSSFGKQLIAFGVGMKIYAASLAALQSGNPVLIAASAGGLIFAGALLATAGGIISGLAGGKRTDNNNNNQNNAPSGGSFGGIRPFASGGIVSGPTNALIGEYPGARNNPEVVAPLDKLTGIIAGSIGGGNMGGQLTARISGNDLVILLDRASKNRKNYF